MSEQDFDKGYRHGHITADVDNLRIIQDLQHALAESQGRVEGLQAQMKLDVDRINNLNADNDRLTVELAAAREGLIAIRDHPYRQEGNIPMPDKVYHTDLFWRSGMKDGHNNCAAIAEKALEGAK